MDANTQSNLKKLSRIIIVAIFVTLIFNPGALVLWTQKLPVNPVTNVLYDVAYQWYDWMETWRLTTVFNSLREAFRFFQEL
jgi:hypothetical protein